MSKTGIYRADEYESAPEDDPDTLISRNKASSRKKKDNTNKEKKAKKNLKPRKSNTPRKQKKNLRERSSSCPPGQTGKDLWLAAVKARSTVGLSGPHRPESPRHKTPTEFWIDTLRRTGAGRSTESTSMNTFSGLRRPNEADMPYLSTSAYTRQMVGVEKPKKYDNPTVKPPSGTPYYKSQEEYYDQIIELKKQIQNLNQDYGALKAKLRRVEEDNIKKEKEIDGLLHPSKNEELRRTLGDKRPESGAVIHSLKQKIMKLETQLRDKESAYIKLQTDLKTTKIEEMKVQLEACFHEIVRLQQSKETGMEKISRGKSESHKMDKAVKETMIRLNKQIEQLKSENQSLRDDLNRDINNVPSEYEDMNRKQLLQAVKKLEKKLKSGGDVDSLMSSEGKAQSGPVEGKLHLSGTVENRLEQLDQRETELLEENKKLHETIKRLKVYRKRYEEKEKEVSMLREDLEQRGMVSSRTPRPVSSRPPSGRRTSVDQRAQQSPRDLPSARSPREQGRAKSPKLRSSESDNIDIEKKVEQLRQKHAAKAIQKNWSKYRQRKATNEENRKINEFRENQAAKKIQRGWTDYKYRKHDKDLDEATELIQSALRGHKSRKSRMKTYRYDDEEMYDDDDESYDNAVNLIQSSFSGHVNRKKRLKNRRQYEEDSEEFSMGHNSDINFSQRPASSGSYRNRPSSALSRGSSSSKGGYGSTSKAKTTTASYSQRQSTFEHDDDDDIAF